MTGLLIAAVFAAAMSTLSSSINSLAAASTYDFWVPLTGGRGDDVQVLRVGRVFTLIWAGLLIGAAVAYVPLAEGSAAVEVALTIASLVYGSFLGAFLLGTLDPRARQGAVIVGMAAGIVLVTSIWVLAAARVGWPWFVPIGALVSITVGASLSRIRRQERAA